MERWCVGARNSRVAKNRFLLEFDLRRMLIKLITQTCKQKLKIPVYKELVILDAVQQDERDELLF
jgi:myo-inositol catabolism protein IolC